VKIKYNDTSMQLMIYSLSSSSFLPVEAMFIASYGVTLYLLYIFASDMLLYWSNSEFCSCVLARFLYFFSFSLLFSFSFPFLKQRLQHCLEPPITQPNPFTSEPGLTGFQFLYIVHWACIIIPCSIRSASFRLLFD